MAGVQFDVLHGVATPDTLRRARKLIAAEAALASARVEAEKVIESRERILSPEAYHALRVAVRLERAPATLGGNQPSVFTNYAVAAAAVESATRDLEAALESEVGAARAALLNASRSALLARYLVFGAENVREVLAKQLDAYPHDLRMLAPRNNAARKIEQTLLLYLQRVATKNDTFSEFGPSGWGNSSSHVNGVAVAPEPRIAKRDAFHERWTAHAIAAAINADPEVFDELTPRLNPNGKRIGDEFFSADTGASIPLSADEWSIAERCDGKAPVHALAAPAGVARGLVEKGVLRCGLEVPALEPRAFAVLCEDVRGWRAGPARDRWLAKLDPIAKLADAFAAAEDAGQRAMILDEVRARFGEIGAAPQSSGRFLYAASNVICEECVRECHFTINDNLLNEVAQQAAPWIDLWRDTYAFVADRVAEGLRGLLETAPVHDGAVSLPAFQRHAAANRLPLTGPGLVALAAMAFQQAKAAFRERLRPHLDAEEYELTLEDCHVIRNSFDYPRFDEYTYPSADLQISAASPEAVQRAEYQWIIGELHPPVALLHHGFYWACPDKPALNRALASTVFGKPSCHFGFFAADFTAHTAVRAPDALGELLNFIAPQRAKPNWRVIPPADVEVYADEETGDVCLRRSGTHEYLGSFARAWFIPLGFHPFQFAQPPHTARLRCGNVIVQRRTWTVSIDELRAGTYTGISRQLVTAIERLRGAKQWPRYVYIRPTERALRRSGAEGRDKDTKPVFIDLESYLFLEVFHRWLSKAGELEVTEMLPDPDHLMWPESDGRRTFELRTQIVPRV